MVCLILTLSSGLRAQDPASLPAAQVFSEAQRAFMSGEFETARAKFQQVLKANPTHRPSQHYLKIIDERERRDGGLGGKRKQIDAITIDRIDLKDADLGSVLHFLKERGEESGNTQINFVPRLPAGYLESRRITLSLSGMPFPEILRYVGNLADVVFKVETHAILVLPANAKADAAPGE